VLYVVHRVPYPPDKGDRIRAFHILRHLSRQADVHLACLADEPVPDSVRSALERHCAQLAVVRLGRWSRWVRAVGSLAVGGSISEGAFWAPQMVRVVRRWAKEIRFRASLASASSVAGYLRVPDLAGVPAVVDLVDVDSQKWFDYAADARWLRSSVYCLEGLRLRRHERTLAGWARAVTLVSEHEAALLRQFVGDAEVHAVANGVDQEYFRPHDCPEGENGCVFVGALDYHPNVDAACWFAREVWPAVHERHPRARLQLVGRKPAPKVRRVGELPGVEVVGPVPDVRPYVAGAAVAVAPLRIARGVQNKVLEAMAMARPVVASPQALAGLGDRPDLPALRATSTSEWVGSLCDLLDDPPRRRRLGLAGRKYVERHHDWERCLEAFLPLLSLKRDGNTSQMEGLARCNTLAPLRAKA
jgi:sugar transferase (PEP-CTERM/EpsH1 system associated)